MLTTPHTLASAHAYSVFAGKCGELFEAAAALSEAVDATPGDDYEDPEEAARFRRGQQIISEAMALLMIELPPQFMNDEDARQFMERLETIVNPEGDRAG